jgi:uncharacterized protein YndB with AHSA1/START domain
MSTVRIEVVYPHPPAKVWRALTDRRALSEWLMDNDFEPRLGHRFQFRTKPQPGFNGIVDCEVTALNEPRKLAYTWGSGPYTGMVVTWTLEELAEGTRLRLEHTGFRGLKGFFLSRILGSGWGRMLKTTLPGVIERVTDDGFIPAPEGTLVRQCH